MQPFNKKILASVATIVSFAAYSVYVRSSDALALAARANPVDTSVLATKESAPALEQLDAIATTTLPTVQEIREQALEAKRLAIEAELQAEKTLATIAKQESSPAPAKPAKVAVATVVKKATPIAKPAVTTATKAVVSPTPPPASNAAQLQAAAEATARAAAAAQAQALADQQARDQEAARQAAAAAEAARQVAAQQAAQASGQYKNGSYTGTSVDAYYGFVQVEAIIQGGKLADVRFLSYPNDRKTSVRINESAMPELIQEAIQAQSANVNGVSGASDTSQAFVESLGAALSQAHA